MRVKLRHLAVAAVVVALLGAGSAQASCETRAFITLPVPTYGPGETVTVSGERFEPGTTVRTRVGTTAATAPVVAEATAEADGSWTATFELSREMAAGGYFVLADALHADGTLVTATAELSVSGERAPGSTPAPEAPSTPGTSPEGERTGRGEAPASSQPDRSQRARPTAPRASSPADTAAPQSAGIAPVEAAVATPAAATRAGANRSKAAPPRPQRSAATPPAAPDSTRTAPLARPEPPRQAEAGENDTLLELGALGLLLLAAAGALLLARRGPSQAPVPQAAPAPRPSLPEAGVAPPSGPDLPVVAPSTPPDVLEAALQELISEEHAREREPAGVGSPES